MRAPVSAWLALIRLPPAPMSAPTLLWCTSRTSESGRVAAAPNGSDALIVAATALPHGATTSLCNISSTIAAAAPIASGLPRSCSTRSAAAGLESLRRMVACAPDALRTRLMFDPPFPISAPQLDDSMRRRISRSK
jgi:hypothetical protein